ncbi:MAG: AraC family transcriptional regulator [Candidatus Nanopelagicales bacterium]
MPNRVTDQRGRYDHTPPLEIIPPHPQHSFRSLTHDYPSPICGWGFHPEYEIHFIRETSGSFIAGDYIGTFGPGQVTLMGPNLPHDWVSDLDPDVVVVDRDAVVQFSDEWVRSCMELMPETLELNDLLHGSRRGLLFSGDTARHAGDLIVAVTQTHGIEQISRMFQLLAVLARAPKGEVETLASVWLGTTDDANAQSAAEAGLEYIFKNLTGDIRLSKAARLACMSEPTFSKYFKKAAGMTFSDMVKKLRIAQAQRLLDSTRDPITHVAAASGYNNLANFNRQFLAEVGMTPRAYRNLDQALKPHPSVLARGTKGVPGAGSSPPTHSSRTG